MAGRGAETTPVKYGGDRNLSDAQIAILQKIQKKIKRERHPFNVRMFSRYKYENLSKTSMNDIEVCLSSEVKTLDEAEARTLQENFNEIALESTVEMGGLVVGGQNGICVEGVLQSVMEKAAEISKMSDRILKEKFKMSTDDDDEESDGDFEETAAKYREMIEFMDEDDREDFIKGLGKGMKAAVSGTVSARTGGPNTNTVPLMVVAAFLIRRLQELLQDEEQILKVLGAAYYSSLDKKSAENPSCKRALNLARKVLHYKMDGTEINPIKIPAFQITKPTAEKAIFIAYSWYRMTLKPDSTIPVALCTNHLAFVENIQAALQTLHGFALDCEAINLEDEALSMCTAFVACFGHRGYFMAGSTQSFKTWRYGNASRVEHTISERYDPTVFDDQCRTDPVVVQRDTRYGRIHGRARREGGDGGKGGDGGGPETSKDIHDMINKIGVEELLKSLNIPISLPQSKPAETPKVKSTPLPTLAESDPVKEAVESIRKASSEKGAVPKAAKPDSPYLNFRIDQLGRRYVYEKKQWICLRFFYIPNLTQEYRGCVQNFKKIRRLLLPLAYVIIPILLQKYYKNT